MAHFAVYQLEKISISFHVLHGLSTSHTDLVLSAQVIEGLSDKEIIQVCRWFSRHQPTIDVIEEMREYGTYMRDLKTLKTIENATSDEAIRQAAQEVYAQLINEQDSKPTPSSSTRKAKPGYVYLIRSGTLYKLGITTDLDKRIAQLNTGLPLGAELLWSVHTAIPKKFETDLHAYFADKRTNGEWFDLEQADIDYIRSLA